MSRVIEWIDYRLPIFTFLRRELNEYPAPRNLTYLWKFGSLSGIVLVIMIVTGIVLAMPSGQARCRSASAHPPS